MPLQLLFSGAYFCAPPSHLSDGTMSAGVFSEKSHRIAGEFRILDKKIEEGSNKRQLLGRNLEDSKSHCN